MPVYSLPGRRREDAPLPRESKKLEKRLKGQLATAVGARKTPQRDPLAHVSERFMKSVDLMGRARAGAADNLRTSAMRDSKEARRGGNDAREQETPRAEAEQQARQADAFLGQSSMESLFESKPGQQDGFAHKFAETTFQRGKMAAAVMGGKGQMMLISSLKRTIGQSQPTNMRQRKLFQSAASAKRNVAGASASKVIFNKGATDSAVGLVSNVLRDARRSVNELAALAEGGNVLNAGSGAETLQKMYPFLSDSEERHLLQHYEAELQACGAGDTQRRLILAGVIKKTQALIDKKQQMKLSFTQHLRKISNQAEEAIVLFETPAFREELHNDLLDFLLLLIPPPNDEDEDKDKDEGKKDEDNNKDKRKSKHKNEDIAEISESEKTDPKPE